MIKKTFEKGSHRFSYTFPGPGTDHKRIGTQVIILAGVKVGGRQSGRRRGESGRGRRGESVRPFLKFSLRVSCHQNGQ